MKRTKVKFPICNQKPERAPHIMGHTFLLCWRCTGIVIGACTSFGMIKFWPLEFRTELFVLAIVSMIPMVCDGIMQYGYTLVSNNFRRFITGLLFGLGLTYSIGFIVADFDSIENHNVLMSSVISIIGFLVTFFGIRLELRKSLKEKLVDQQRAIYAEVYRKISELVRKPDLIFNRSYYDEFVLRASELRLSASNEVIENFMEIERIVEDGYLKYIDFCDKNDPYNDSKNFELVYRDEAEEPIELYHGTEMEHKIFDSKISEYMLNNTPSKDEIESIAKKILNSMRTDIGNSAVK